MLEPTANMFLPKVVLFQTTHISPTRIREYSTYIGTRTPAIVNSVPVTRSRYCGSKPDRVCPLFVPIFR